MQNQAFRPPQPQRGQTNSPAQFPGQGAQDPSRMGTPSNPMMGGPMRGMPFNQMNIPPQQNNLAFPSAQAGQPAMNNLPDAAHQYRQRMQQQQQALQQRSMPGGVDPNTRAMMSRMNGGQTPQQQNPGAGNPAQQAQNARAMQTAQQFQRGYYSWAQKQLGISPNMNPVIAGRPINVYQLFHQGTKVGVIGNTPTKGNWPVLAQSMGLQDPNAQLELKNVFENQGLFSYSVNYIKHMREQKQAHSLQQGQLSMPTPGQAQHSPTPPQGPFGPQPGGTPTSQPAPGMQHPPNNFHSTPQPRHVSIPDQNGVVTPADAPFKSQSPMASASPSIRPPSLPHHATDTPNDVRKSPSKPVADQRALDRVKSPTYKPLVRSPDDKFGGLDLGQTIRLGHDIDSMSVTARAASLGPIDLHQLTMTLQSGMDMEVANALDALATATKPELSSILGIQLAECEHLLDALVEFAEIELEALAAGCCPSSESMQIPHFQTLFTRHRRAVAMIRKRRRAGQDDHELERSAERIATIVLILRNLAVQEDEITVNILSDESIVSVLTSIIRSMGTRRRVFRTDEILLNIMKDLVVLLSIISTRLELPSEEDAETILHFLIAFAPSPSPLKSTAAAPGVSLEFTPYAPTDHQYLPHAVESLAKILARDDPNRVYFRSIFQNEASCSPPSPLLLGAFAVALAPIPDMSSRPLDQHGERMLVRGRIAFFSMAMLCGDILSSLAPSTPLESASNGVSSDEVRHPASKNICDALLESSDDWAHNLAHLIPALAWEQVKQMQGPNGQIMSYDREFGMITSRGLAMLQKLASKAYQGSGVLNGLFKVEEVTFAGLLNPAFDGGVLRQMMGLVRARDGHS